ncbi:uncharacterized protein Nmag_1250 [Natrialba magadii ATCC 43099]|uniref:Uncharacterized protein n=1 Tax=Natrialba magadii (strain ATCC 43099 / DSM 3394 / CCM 3739 / CIP 104546 / IAM 13178 / JCM 8861 / NBRC 102185 / NCIMB 2190 / MS3) TaxID=547559 RepID=D3SSA6_NATMM|nr:hypothetical protein [Natrialba magadii]ADD04832.1 uncharacterized protein Nmag_1250 [Natrialba magadii ATCC 43099]ELY24498.1 hypothetical protein C500_18760 [Natrialba magadii ATCC 43099]
MGTRVDAALAVLTLAIFGGLALASGTSLSPSLFVVGGALTVGFELLAARDPARVRYYWERWSVQFGSLALAALLAVGGAWFAPVIVLSLGCGALVTYCTLLLAWRMGVLPPLQTWWQPTTKND